MSIAGLAAPMMVTPATAAQEARPATTVPAATPAAGLTQGAVPDSYVWDGSEYVGMVGHQYYYLNSHKYWAPMSQPGMQRFDAYAKTHPNWKSHCIRNLNYRRDANGHVVPLAGPRGQYQIK